MKNTKRIKLERSEKEFVQLVSDRFTFRSQAKMSDLFPFVNELAEPATKICDDDPTIETGFICIIEDEEWGLSFIDQPDSLSPTSKAEPTHDGDASIRKWEYDVFHSDQSYTDGIDVNDYNPDEDDD